MATPKKRRFRDKPEKPAPEASLNETSQEKTAVSGDDITKSAAPKEDSDQALQESTSGREIPKNSNDSSGEAASSSLVSSSPDSTPADEGVMKSSLLGFPVVGIGASAGGLEAIVELLQNLPPQPDVAIIFIQHLDPRYRSNLVEILSRTVKIPVCEAEDGMLVEKNSLYIIPPDRDLAMMHGKLQLMSRPEGPARHLPIDYFFRSLAEDQVGNAVGIILSGTGSDGALGIRAINASGGITLVQQPTEAKYNGMPTAAVATGHVDLVLPAKKIALELARIARQPRRQGNAVEQRDVPASAEQQELDKVFMMVRRASGVDFSQYKRSSVERRLSRRMLLHRVDSLKHYVKYLQQNPAEISALFEDMLINVTSFFREPEAFQALRDTVFPRILAEQSPEAPIRIWVPACSTGEEAFSIAITLIECLGEEEPQRPIQVFATDVSPASIEKARQGKYPENIAGEVSAERLQKFFVKIDDGYQVRKSIREMCVFAVQNLAKDPPFSKLDLISCRNVLIYMDAPLQKRIMPIFHYAIRPNGFLLLGAAETVGDFSDLFSLVDRKQRLYLRKPGVVRVPIEFTPLESEQAEIKTKGEVVPIRQSDLEKDLQHLISQRYGPNGVLVNEQLEIERFFGQTGRFFEPTPGLASLNLLKIIRPNLGADVRTIIQEAKTTRKVVRKERLRIRVEEAIVTINIEIFPVGERHYLVVFEEATLSSVERKAAEPSPAASDSQEEIDILRSELANTKESLQAIIEEHEATNEELRAANEEIQSSNEELQSTNEELTTAKEELQSTNEELTTVNEEQETRNDELREALNDVSNLLNSVNIPLLILDSELKIRRFAPSSGDSVFRLIPADCGRPIGELRLGFQRLDMEKLERSIREVIRTLDVHEEHVQAQDGNWYAMRIRPYRTSDDRISGAVVALFDITERRRVEQQLESSRQVAECMQATVHEPVLVMDRHCRVISANAAFYEMFQITPRQTEGHSLFEVGNRQWDIPAMRSLLAEITESGPRNYRLENEFSGVGRKTLLINAARVGQNDDSNPLIFVAFKEATDEAD